MEASIITRIITPLAIVLIMFGLGMSLTLDDFRRVWTRPKSISTGIILQIIGLPILGFTFIDLLDLRPELAASVMLVSACPGGAITNLVSFIANGDAALSVSLTAINSFITVVTIPIVVTFSLIHFMGAETASEINVLKLSMGIIAITIPPIIAGMVLKQKRPNFAESSEKWLRWATIASLALIATIAAYHERRMIAENYGELTVIAVALCLLSTLMGITAGIAVRLPKKHVLTLGIEVGMHNSGMGIVIALSLLDMKALAIFPAFYLLVEYVFSGLIMAIMNSKTGKKIMNGGKRLTGPEYTPAGSIFKDTDRETHSVKSR